MSKSKVITAKKYRGDKAWDALDIANMDGISVRLHWTNKPYKWHINDGQEVFVVLDGMVDMHYRLLGNEYKKKLNVGDIFYADIGTEHIAKPVGEARILVIEKAGSI